MARVMDEHGAVRKPKKSLFPTVLMCQLRLERGELKATLEGLSSIWATIGIVSALLTTMTFPAVIDPPYAYVNDPDTVEDPYLRGFVMLNFLSCLSSVIVVVLVTVFLANSNMVVDESDQKEFIMRVAPLHDVMSLVLVPIMGISACGQMMCVVWYSNEEPVAIACSVAMGLGGLIGFGVALWVFGGVAGNIHRAWARMHPVEGNDGAK